MDRLPALVSVAAEITLEHEAVSQAVRSGLEHARRAGDLLLKAKADLEHGAWLPWLSEHCPTVSARVAQGYMRIAREWPRLKAQSNTKRASHLSVREGLALLAEPRLPAQIQDGYRFDEIDWPARFAQMEAARDDLGAALDELKEARGSTDPHEIMGRIRRAEELEDRAVALKRLELSDLRAWLWELASLCELDPPNARRPLTNPAPIEAFFATVRSRLADLEAARG